MPPSGDQYDRSPMAILMSPFLDPYFALDPREVSPTRLFTEKFLIISDHLRHNPAAGNIIVVNQNETTCRFEGGRQVERNRSFGSQGQFCDLVTSHLAAALLLTQVHGIDDPVDGRHLALDFSRGHS